jgi:hypothetical protein
MNDNSEGESVKASSDVPSLQMNECTEQSDESLVRFEVFTAVTTKNVLVRKPNLVLNSKDGFRNTS